MKTRYIAAIYHLMATLLVCGAAAWLVLAVWYPGDFSTVLHVSRVLGLFVACDVVLGPMMSLIICSPRKPRRELFFDYAVIGSVQIAAIVYGLAVFASSRPVNMVWAVDRFEIVSAQDVTPALKPGAAPIRQTVNLLLRGPQFVKLVLPTTAADHNRLLEQELSGLNAAAQSQYHAPYSPNDALARAHAIDELTRLHPELQPFVHSAQTRTRLTPSQLKWVPVKGPKGFFTAVLRTDSGDIVGLYDVDPY